jgi:hypothetical protein
MHAVFGRANAQTAACPSMGERTSAGIATSQLASMLLARSRSVPLTPSVRIVRKFTTVGEGTLACCLPEQRYISMTKIEELKELQSMLDQGLIDQSEYAKLRAEILSPSNVAVPYLPSQPQRSEVIFRNRHTGQMVRLTASGTFWLTMLFGIFYFAYHRVWLHVAIGGVAGFFTYGLSWFIYPFFAYRLIVGNYRQQGWVEAEVGPNSQQVAQVNASGFSKTMFIWAGLLVICFIALMVKH